MSLPGSRIINGIGFFICAFSIVFAIYYLQHTLDLEPCPLCILDRAVILMMGIIFLVAMIHNPGQLGQRIYAGINLLVVGSGIGVAGRHIWLQHLPPDQVPGCGPGLGYMLDAFPLFDVLQSVLRGSGECAEVSWRFLGLSIPEQVLLLFMVLASLMLIQIFRRAKF